MWGLLNNSEPSLKKICRVFLPFKAIIYMKNPCLLRFFIFSLCFYGKDFPGSVLFANYDSTSKTIFLLITQKFVSVFFLREGTWALPYTFFYGVYKLL